MAQSFLILPFFKAVLGIAIALGAGSGQNSPTRPPDPSATPAATTSRVATDAPTPQGTNQQGSAAAEPGGTHDPAPDSATSESPGGTSGTRGKSGPETSPIILDQGASRAESEMGTAADAELQMQIQNALNKDPTLGGRGLRATVTEQHIELSGSVTTSREKLTAARLALSYAGNKKLVNAIVMTGRASTPLPPAPSHDNATGPPTGKSAAGYGSETPAAKSQSYQGARPPQP